MTNDILSSGGSSDFLEARKYFRSNMQNEKEKVIVFVEDEIDSLFWRFFFEGCTQDVSFEIKVLKNNDNELSGKDALIKYVKLDSLGKNKLIAVDSDYDYIIDNYHDYTQKLRECKYAIHTSDSYSIENHKIHPSLLKSAVYLTSLAENISEDIDNMLYQASEIYSELFYIHLFSVYRKDKVYIQSNFKSDLSKLSYNNDNISVNTKEYICKRLKNFKKYKEENDLEYERFRETLQLKGITDFNCWQFMKGHDIFDEIGTKIVASISCKYRGYYMKTISAISSDETRKKDLINKFNNETGVGSDDCHDTLKNRIRRILIDIKPDMIWDPSSKIYDQIKEAILQNN